MKTTQPSCISITAKVGNTVHPNGAEHIYSPVINLVGDLRMNEHGRH